MSTRNTVTTTAAIPTRRRRHDWYTTLTFFGFVGPLLLGLLIFTALPLRHLPAHRLLVRGGIARLAHGPVQRRALRHRQYAHRAVRCGSHRLDSDHAVDVAGAGHRAPMATAWIHHAHLPRRSAGDP